MKSFEDIIFLQGHEAEESLDILSKDGQLSAIEHLKQWHNPGEHVQSPGLGTGTHDKVFESENYHLVYNTGIGYIGLSYEINE